MMHSRHSVDDKRPQGTDLTAYMILELTQEWQCHEASYQEINPSSAVNRVNCTPRRKVLWDHGRTHARLHGRCPWKSGGGILLPLASGPMHWDEREPRGVTVVMRIIRQRFRFERIHQRRFLGKRSSTVESLVPGLPTKNPRDLAPARLALTDQLFLRIWIA